MQQYGRNPPKSLTDLPVPRMRSGVHPSSREPEPDEAAGRRGPASQPVSRQAPAAEPTDGRSRLDGYYADASEAAAFQDFQPVSDGDVEQLDGQIEALVEQLRAAEERAAYAEQHAIHAGQQAAYAEQQLAMRGASAAPQTFAYTEPDAPHSSGFAKWTGWCLFLIVAGLAAAAYFTMYEPLRLQLAAQTKLSELQNSQRRDAEAALRTSFDRERETLNEQLNAARAAAPVATTTAVADAPAAHQAVEHPTGLDRAAASKAAKREARDAKHEAMLAKKAERAAKREEHAAKHKEHSATTSAAVGGRRAASAADKSEAADKPAAAEPKHKAKPAADEAGGESSSNDPLDGL